MSSTSSVASALALIANPQTFTGVSKYSSDMQSILVRTQQIAQIPVTALQNDQATLQSEVTALTSLQSAVGDLASAISSLGSLASAGALSVASDNTSVSAAVSGSGATAGVYTIGNVSSLASVSTATMVDAVADPAATTVAPTDTNKLYLSVGGKQTTIELTADTNNLNGLRDAINGANAGVSASIVKTSGGSYLTLTASVAGASAITLNTAVDGAGTEILSMNNTGSLAHFEVNGKAETSTSNQITGVIPGIALTLKATTAADEKTTITVAGNPSAVANALQIVAAAYNALSASISSLTAQNSGVLAGSQVVRSVQQQMREFGFYKATGGIQSLMDLGASFDKTGKVTVDSATLSAMTPGQLTNVLTFLGDGTTGLSSLSKGLSSFSDISSGLIQQNITQDQASEQRLQNQIDAMTLRIQVSQNSQMAKLQAADAMLAMLTSQQSVLTASIQSLNFTLYGTQVSSGAGA